MKLGDFVTVHLPQGREGSGRIVGIDEGPELIYAVERDDVDSVTWHGRDELSPE